MSIAWYFRERDKGEPIVGGVDNFAFQMSIDTLVRETIQNANDQRIGDKVVVEFLFEEHSGSSANKMLNLIGWEQGLKEHLTAIANGESHLKQRASRALKTAQDKKFSSLTIRDFGARGLEGPEDGDSGNFAMLCRHVLVTDSSNKRVGGGSFGLGKSVLWAFSGASVALFSSSPVERSTSSGKRETLGSPRVFGRAYLVSHKFGAQENYHNGDGHLGTLTPYENKFWATSLRGDDAQNWVADSTLQRDWVNPGTSILIPFFDNPRVDEELSLADVVAQITAAVQRWFWPSLLSGALEVHVGGRSGGNDHLSTVQTPDWVKFFRRALEAEETQPITEDVGATQVEITVAVPERTADKKHQRVSGKTDLHLTRVGEDEAGDIPPDILNSVALVRGAQMVVEYHRRSFSPLLPQFVGVLKAGRYRDFSDDEVEGFFRDSEPPSHDRWDSQSEKIGLNYKKGGQKSIRDFYQELAETAKRLLGASTVSSGSVPRKLAELLRGGKGASKKARVEKFEMMNKSIDRSEVGKIGAEFTVKRNFGTGPWASKISVVIVDEQNSQHDLEIIEIDKSQLESAGILAQEVLASDGLPRNYVFTVPQTEEEFTVKVVAKMSSSDISTRMLADVKATYKQGGWS